MLKKDIVVPYLEKFPDSPNKTLAKIIVNEHPGLFNSISLSELKAKFASISQKTWIKID